MIQPVRCSFLADRGPERPTSCGNPGSQLLYACHSLSLPPDGAAYLQKISLGCWVNDGNKGYIPEGLWRNQGPGGRRSRTGAIQSLSSNCSLHNLFCNACGIPISTKAPHVRSHTPAGTPRLPWAATHISCTLTDTFHRSSTGARDSRTPTHWHQSSQPAFSHLSTCEHKATNNRAHTLSLAWHITPESLEKEIPWPLWKNISALPVPVFRCGTPQKEASKGQEVMLAGLPSGRGRARAAQHRVPQT